MTTASPLIARRSTSTGSGAAPSHRIAAAAAIIAIITRLASILTWPPNADASHAKMLATAGARHGAWTLATWLEVVTWIAAGIAVLTCVRLVTGRGRRITLIGGWAYGASLLTLGYVGGVMNNVTGVLAERPGHAEMTTIVDKLDSAPSMMPFVAVVMIGEVMAIVLAIGLVRARLVGWWIIALTLVAEVGYLMTSDSSNHLVILAGFIPLAVFWGTIARLLTTSPSSD